MYGSVACDCLQGFFWIAARPELVWEWSTAGTSRRFAPYGRWLAEAAAKTGNAGGGGAESLPAAMPGGGRQGPVAKLGSNSGPADCESARVNPAESGSAIQSTAAALHASEAGAAIQGALESCSKEDAASGSCRVERAAQTGGRGTGGSGLTGIECKEASASAGTGSQSAATLPAVNAIGKAGERLQRLVFIGIDLRKVNAALHVVSAPCEICRIKQSLRLHLQHRLVYASHCLKG